VQAGDLFCALPGSQVDGHAFVAQAARAGAAAALVERLATDVELPQLQVTDTRLGIAHLASLFYEDPAEELALVGVTGTNGKSTTVWLARHLLSDLGPAGAVGTLGVVHPSGELAAGGLTTPDPIALMQALADLGDEGSRSVSLEVSSHALDQRRADALRFAAVVFTSFSREHLEYHQDLDDYLATKLRLVELLRPGGLCAVNADEPAWLDIEYEEGRVWRYGLAAAADVRAVDLELGPHGSRWRLVTPAGDALVELPLPGGFNVRNALAAATVGLDAGLVPERIAELLGGTPPVPGRMEVLRREPSVVLRDYAHTPDAFERALGALRPGVEGRLIAVFGCGGERDPGKRPLMGEIAARLADLTIVTSDNPRSEDPEAIIAQVVADADPAKYEVVVDRRDAIVRALDEAAPGDVVVLLGKGHETYQLVGDERQPFDEATIVRELSAGSAEAAVSPDPIESAESADEEAPTERAVPGAAELNGTGKQAPR
jgi:UDP-N-acetylmuramoyl-L-alanyl-D-glutamate--2,6-diaminopimelate ligase